MAKTSRERVALYRIRKEADAFADTYLSDELVTVSEFIKAMTEADCDRGGYAQVKYPQEDLAEFKDALGHPKRTDELHYEDLFLTWHKIREKNA